MKKIKIAFLFVLIVLTGFINKPSERVIDVMFCVDLSSSTDGISEIIQSEIWNFINHCDTYKDAANIRIGLIGFGRRSFGENNGHVKVFGNLSTDYDKVIQELYYIESSTNSNNESASLALEIAVNGMNWSKSKESLRAVYFIGNGSLASEISDIQGSCEKAVKKDILINSIFFETGKRIGIDYWEKVAEYGKGSFLTVNRNKALMNAEFGFNEEMLIDAGLMMNNTFLSYGEIGSTRKSILQKIDIKSLERGVSCVYNRMVFKAGEVFQKNQSSWDLIEKSQQANFDLSKIDRTQLEEEYQSLPYNKLEEIINLKKNERREISEIIKMLSVKHRDKYVQIQNKKKRNEINSFSGIMIRNFDESARSKGFDKI